MWPLIRLEQPDQPGHACMVGYVKLRSVLAEFIEVMTVGSDEPGVNDTDRPAYTPVVAEIDVQQFRERLRDYLMGHYLGLHITVVIVILAVAGLAAASLIGRHGITYIDLSVL